MGTRFRHCAVGALLIVGAASTLAADEPGCTVPSFRGATSPQGADATIDGARIVCRAAAGHVGVAITAP